MYTSGWPKNQNRFCHRIGRPPRLASKMCVPRWRSQNSRARAVVKTGKAMMASVEATSMFQTKIGIRNMVMPGARRVKIVVTMLMPDSTVAIPVRPMPMIHRSAPAPGEWTALDSGA